MVSLSNHAPTPHTRAGQARRSLSGRLTNVDEPIILGYPMKSNETPVTINKSGNRVDPVIIRGHTLLCLQGFRGEGYSPDFIDNMAAIHARLQAEPGTPVRVTDTPDHFCVACPNLKGSPQFDSGGRSGEEAAGSSHAPRSPALAPAEPDARFLPGAAAGSGGIGGRGHDEERAPASSAAESVRRPVPHGPPDKKVGCTLRGPDFERHIVSQDRQVLGLLGLKVGQEVTWAEVLSRIGSRMRGEMLDGICGDCQWLALGYCKEGIDQLRHSINGEVVKSE